MGGFNWRELLDCDSPGSSRSKILNLPPEVLAHILSFLSGKDISNASRVCKDFYHACQIESVWQKRCVREYGVILPSTQHNISHRLLYTKILHKYGHLIGLWNTDIANYGGLLQVKAENGKLLGLEWHPPTNPDVRGSVRKRLLFSLEVLPGGQTQTLCGKGGTPHKCQLLLTNKNSFLSKCLNTEHHRRPAGDMAEYRDWLREESAVLQPEGLNQLSLVKFLMIRQYENAFKHERLLMPRPQPEAIIQPGLFKGTYSAHGLELVMLKYEENGTRVTATKITGDPNVPAGQVSFKVDLHYPIILNEENQLDIQELQRREIVHSPIPLKRLPRQPFRLPSNCLTRECDVPDTCKGRFFAFGQIAGHGFTNPSYTKAHWIVFNEDLMGLLWFDLLTLSVFHRVQELIR